MAIGTNWDWEAQADMIKENTAHKMWTKKNYIYDVRLIKKSHYQYNSSLQEDNWIDSSVSVAINNESKPKKVPEKFVFYLF